MEFFCNKFSVIEMSHKDVQSHKMVKHTQTIRRQFPDKLFECFDHFMGMVLKGWCLILSKTTVNENVFTKGKYFKMKIMLQEHHLESTLNSCTKIDRGQRK